jgi:hypothetical protein
MFDKYPTEKWNEPEFTGLGEDLQKRGHILPYAPKTTQGQKALSFLDSLQLCWYKFVNGVYGIFEFACDYSIFMIIFQYCLIVEI